MFCVSIGIKDFKLALDIISEYEMAEIRLDICEFDRRQIKEIFSFHPNLIATFRSNNRIKDKYRESILKTAIVSGAKFIDLDMNNNSPVLIREMIDFSKEYNCNTILSVHDYQSTPPDSVINSFIKKAKDYNPDYIKLVFYSNGIEDNERVLNLYDSNKNIIAFNMGEKGKITRVKALELGAPFMYVSHNSMQTAPGQMTREEIKKYPQN
ncbi:MAG TPA: type I 3-dehydroquinate dehydratase [Bacteroidetes bacterium]|nr:type I 3-dehydroquinate dehydratase [Bacteroidota bacterium]